MMDRRRFLLTSLAGALAVPRAAGAQETKVHRIGVLSPPADRPAYFAAFEEGLRQLGYVRGRNILFETRGSGTKTIPGAVADLVRLKVEVIITGPNQYIDVAKQIATNVPIVMVYGSDPVGRGYVASLARPGGNITGLIWEPTPEIFGKYVEFLTAFSPRPSRIAGIVDPTNAYQSDWKEADNAAKRHGVTLEYFEVRTDGDVPRAFSTIVSTHAGAAIIGGGPNLWTYRRQIADVARKSGLPTLYMYREGPEDGGLLSYGTSLRDSWQRAATYVDKILKGVKPADLPVEQPTKFELVINLKTAKALGLTIPPSLLARADQVIE
jgi:putative tryptophan/tyrosine transport system substrate-binding protein